MSDRAGGSGLDSLLEASWTGRGRPIRGRELRIEVGVTALFLAAAVTLAVLGARPSSLEPAEVIAVLGYAAAAMVEFPIGAAYFVPTQLMLVPMFAVAPPAVVPLLVFLSFLLAAGGATVAGRHRIDRAAFCANDSVHALGPALVLTVLADGRVDELSVLVFLLAYAAQFIADLISSSLHELVSMGARSRVHASLLARVWGGDMALGAVAMPVAAVALDTPWVVAAPVPLIALLRAIAADRTRSLGSAYERLVALEQERAARQAAAELVERQSQFLGDVSHELRTPVTIARGHLEALVREETTPAFAVAMDELGRLERIIERLLVLARSEQAQPALRQHLDAERFLEDRFMRWSESVMRAWQLDDLVPGTLTADTDAIAAALDALIENAVKHTTAHQQISLSSSAEGDRLNIVVADAGGGIPSDALDQIFQRFGRADSARNREAGGVGLGLAIVDAVAKAHDGRCAVRSSPGGSTFTLTVGSFSPAG